MKYIVICCMAIVFFGVQRAKAQAVVNSNSKTKILNNEVKIAESNLEQEFTIQNKDVSIVGDGNKIKINGTVGKLSISGNDNEIDVESVKEIAIKFNYNFVSWQQSPNANGKPIISDKGGYNNVGKKSGAALDKSDN